MELIRCNINDQRPDRTDELCDWVRSFGVSPEDVRPTFVIGMGAQGYELHLSEYVCDGHGRKVVDVAAGDVVSKPLVVDLGQAECWPGWLNGSDYRYG